jgi:autotransporter-associated beta strand protein
MRKIHENAVSRRRSARRAVVAAASSAVLLLGRGVRADNVWTPTNSYSWSDPTPPTNWSAGVIPGTGSVVDIYSGSPCTFDAVSSGDLEALQVASGNSLNISATGGQNYTLDTLNLAVGGSLTGVGGGATNIGAGTIVQSTSHVVVDVGGTFGVDPISKYSLSGSGNILSYANEQLAGTFTQSGGTNLLSAGQSLNNSGYYSISSSAAVLADIYNNTNNGTFNQGGGTIEGSNAQGSGGTFAFNNSGTFIYTSGNFYGVMNNTGNVQVNAATIPFGQGVINNGVLTANGSSGTYASNISGGASAYLYFKLPTNLTLSGSNTYLGSTVVSSGTLLLNSPLGNSTNHYGGALGGPVTINTGATVKNLAGNQISGVAPLFINGGTYNLNGFDNSVGSINFSTGTITTTNLGPGIGLKTGNVSTSRGASSITGGIRTNTTLTFNLSSNAPLTVNGVMGNYNSTLGVALVLTGGGTLYCSGASDLYTVDIQNGTMAINEGGNLGGFNTLFTVENGGVLSLGNQTLTIGNLTGGTNSNIGLGTGSLSVNTSSTGSTYPGTFTGSGTLNVSGSGTLTLSGNVAFTGPVNVSAGTLTLASTSYLSSSSVSVAAGATLNLNGILNTAPALAVNGTVNIPQYSSGGIFQLTLGAVSLGSGGPGQISLTAAVPHANHTLMVVNSLSFSGASGSWLGQLDLSNNDLVIHNANFNTIYSQVQSGFAGGSWNGSGITSSAAANDTTHLTAIGVISNDLGSGLGLYSKANNSAFDNFFPEPSDLLLKYTYYGDANLDGKVDSTDYTLIDNGYLNSSTGWYNGDFNYDGVVNGSDYTLIDNAFNNRGPNLSVSTQIAAPTAQIAGTGVTANAAVPEPDCGLMLIAIGTAAALRRRRPRPVLVL